MSFTLLKINDKRQVFLRGSGLNKKAAKLRKYLKLFEKEPEAGLFKPTVKAFTKNGLVIARACMRAGDITWKVDLPPCLGGKGATIGPVHYLLGALAGCAASLIKNTLAPLMEYSVDSVEVDVQCNIDVRGILGMEGATGDIRNVSLTVTVHSDEAPDKIEKLFEIWKQRAPVFLCFQKPVHISTNLIIKKPLHKC